MTINDGHGALLRGIRHLMTGDPALAPLLDGELPSLTIENMTSEAWASVTFSGQRHRVDLKLRGHGAELDRMRERLRARLHDAEIELRGHVLVDMTLARAETCSEDGEEVCRLSFEALTVED
jgi:hypothetical protein